MVIELLLLLFLSGGMKPSPILPCLCMLQFFLCDIFPKNENFLFPFLFALLSLPALYRVYQEILNRFEIALNFAKQLLVSSFLYNIASLKTFLELKFCKPGGGGSFPTN